MARSQRRHYMLEKSVPTPGVPSRNSLLCAAQSLARPQTQRYGRNAPEGQIDFYDFAEIIAGISF